jgi:hypothetical protein
LRGDNFCGDDLFLLLFLGGCFFGGDLFFGGCFFGFGLEVAPIMMGLAVIFLFLDEAGTFIFVSD